MSQPFSVCMSVYKNDIHEYFNIALNSVINQTIQPNEIILVIDGPVSESIDNLIDEFKFNYPIIKTIRLPQNKGLGNALNIAVSNASYSLIARMDSDDISIPNRFEKQLLCFEKDPELSVVGGSIDEFVDVESNIVGHRICPLTDSEIKKYMKSRCGFNHMTVMMKKNDVLSVGNYKDWFWNEDYFLWIRMMDASYKFMNLQQTMVKVRVGTDMYARRGGMKYFKSEVSLHKYMWDHGIINFLHFCFNIFVRLIVEIFMPNKVRVFFFQNFFRKKKFKSKP